MNRLSSVSSILVIKLLLIGCVGPTEGPDKQFQGELSGAALGAGAGAVTGFQVGASTGPGALVGAGFGAAAGAIQGFIQDQTEEDLLALAAETNSAKQRAIAHEILSEHYKRRLELHPTRDIYPADLFFYADSVKLRRCAIPLLSEIARMNKERLSWSRVRVVVYNKSKEGDSSYASHLALKRSRAIVNQLARNGIEGRRLEAKGVIVEAPILVDPGDNPSRYSQAVEIVPLDR